MHKNYFSAGKIRLLRTPPDICIFQGINPFFRPCLAMEDIKNYVDCVYK